MLLTEEQAKEKWCPMVRTGLTAGMAVNHHVAGEGREGVHDETRCIASGCMMWRKTTITTHKPSGEKFSYPLVINASERDHYEVDRSRGFCGLAGREGLR